METGTLTYRINRRGDLTVFAQVGWLFPWLTLGGSVMLLVYAAIRRISAGKITGSNMDD
jgi:hypothetical protein